MKKSLLVVVCFTLLGGCTFLKNTGATVCGAQDKISGGISNVGDFFGGPGNVVAGGINIALKTVCGLFDNVVSAPHSVGADLGIVSDGEEPGENDGGDGEDDGDGGEGR